MLDDLLVSDTGMVPLGLESPTHALMGRFGNMLLVNGEPSYQLSVRRDEVVRFFLTNAANARTFNLSFPGARMKIVASDIGRLRTRAMGRKRGDRTGRALCGARKIRSTRQDRAGKPGARARPPVRPLLWPERHPRHGGSEPAPRGAEPER